MRYGYKASAEQFGPSELLSFALQAERLGFDDVASSDHFQPWRHVGGHSPAVLPWLGALGGRSERIRMGTSVLTPTFRYHPAVVAQAEVAWWFLAAMQPLAGVVFALDGVLMGAGDVGYLRTVTIGSALLGFLPLSLLALPLGWGLAGVWSGLTLFIVLRLVGVALRVAGDRWLRAPDTVTA